MLRATVLALKSSHFYTISNIYPFHFELDHIEIEGNAEMTRGNENKENQMDEEDRFSQKSGV